MKVFEYSIYEDDEEAGSMQLCDECAKIYNCEKVGPGYQCEVCEACGEE